MEEKHQSRASKVCGRISNLMKDTEPQILGAEIIHSRIYTKINWIDLESIMLSEISQSEKDKYHMISVICGI